MAEIASDLGSALGQDVEYRPQSFESFEKDFGSTRAEFFEYLTNGFYCRASPDFFNLTGRKPTSYAEYLRSKGAAGETGLEEASVLIAKRQAKRVCFGKIDERLGYLTV